MTSQKNVVASFFASIAKHRETIAGLAVVCVVVILAIDAFLPGVLDRMPFSAQGVLLSVFALFVAMYQLRKETSEKVSRLVEKIGYAEAEVFRDIDDYYEAITACLKKARTVDAINFIPQPPNGPPSRVRYYEELKERIKHAQVKAQRIVAITSREKLAWVKKDQIDEFTGCNNFSVAAVGGCGMAEVPLMTMIIIDNDVFLGMYWGKKLASQMEKNIHVMSSALAEAFRAYFTSLWLDSRILLYNGEPNPTELQAIEDCLTEDSDDAAA